jgi:hypothetical protein
MTNRTEYCLDGILQLPPHFPPPLFSDASNFPLAFLDDVQIQAWRTAKRFPKNTPFVYDIVLRLHQLGLATSSDWYSEVDQRALSNLYFEASRGVITIQFEEPWVGTLPQGAQGREAATMFRVWTYGLTLFVTATVRHLKSRLGRTNDRSEQEPVLARIREALEASGGHQSWPRGKSLEPVLATLYYGIESCGLISPWRIWAMDALRKVIGLLKFKSVEDFRKALEFFPLTEEYKANIDGLWTEVFHVSVSATPTLTLTNLQ